MDMLKTMSKEEKDCKLDKKLQRYSYFGLVASGTASGILTTTVVHPLDLVKVRLQIYPMPISTEAMARKILRCEGIPALYNGLTAAYLRQVTFTPTRLTIYYIWHEQYYQKYGFAPCLLDKIYIGLWAGIVGGLVGNPSEVALIRMMADGRKDPCCVKERLQVYNGVFHALFKISMTEGFFALWRGATLTITRACCMSVLQIGCYTKTVLIMTEQGWVKEEDIKSHLIASFLSGFITAVVTLPVDTMKTNYQIRSDNVPLRKVFLDALQRGGVFILWQGFIPYFIRLSLHSMLSYVLIDQIRIMFRIFKVFQK